MSSTPDKPNTAPGFQQLQHRFTAHIRDRQAPLPEGIEDRRMQVYRDLIFNNIEGFTTSAFPVAKSIMGELWWQQAVQDFIRDYQCQSPYFHHISEAFLAYLTDIRPPTDTQPDFMPELMHYEWVELALDIAEADPFHDGAIYSGNLLDGHPVQSPLAWALGYRYPVHQISVENQPQQAPAQPTWLMVYRNHQDEVQFMVLNALTARLLRLLDQAPRLSGRRALQQVADETGQPDTDALVAAGEQILHQFYDAGILLGAQSLKEHAK